MTTEYKINGSGMSLAPVTVHWQPNVIARDHNLQPVYSNYFDVVHVFSPACAAYAYQWLNAVSTGSVNLTTLGRWSATSFTVLSGVYFEITQAPVVESIYTNEFVLTVKNALGAGLGSL